MLKTLISALALGLMLSAAPAWAGEPTTVLLQNATARYADLDFEKALKLLDKAQATRGNTRNHLIRIHHLRGLCLGSLGRYQEASRSFAHLVALDPSFRLGGDVSPRIRKPFQKLVRNNPPRFNARLLPPPHAVRGKSVNMTAKLKDTLGMAKTLEIKFRPGNAGTYSTQKTTLSGDGDYQLNIPSTAWEGSSGLPGKKAKTSGPSRLSWYAQVLDKNGGILKRFGHDLHPLSLEVIERSQLPAVAGADKASPWYSKWWVWTIVGGVVVAGAATASVMVLNEEPSKGPYNFTVDFD